MRQLEQLHEKALPSLPARCAGARGGAAARPAARRPGALPIAHLVYAAAKAGHTLSDRFLLEAARHLLSDGGARIAAASGGDLAQLSWGMARAGVLQPELQGAIDEAVAARASEFDMKVVSMLLTAAHLSRNTSAAPLAALTRRALELAPGAPPQMLATLAHSLVKLAQPSHAALEAFAVALEPQLADLDRTSLLLTLEAYRIAAHPSGRALAAAAAPLVEALVPSLTAPQLVRVARVYAALMPAGARPGHGGGGAASGSGGGVGSGSGSSGGHNAVIADLIGSSQAAENGVLVAVNEAAVGRLSEFGLADLNTLLRSLKGLASPEIRAAASVAAMSRISQQAPAGGR
ncbi:hypothetical protein MNEG_12400 [Monoraphidium neglectum]|uniref:Uncharacterized protein n=1 Tax=Monoraphidium neglectum TaxID=145388 RepID=A0A0D2M2E6_9CHLO|nr:hypothetical protein MNEG_12400 [Monoraphidium neglectum]KIY95561.1 hypothetical protein MNEG_12400 [Monoraphidium neglectum]|eukprot:XP_013894581.1 hypothetical protein MNEG_12400 [Monoraphidium neglectum]